MTSAGRGDHDPGRPRSGATTIRGDHEGRPYPGCAWAPIPSPAVLVRGFSCHKKSGRTFGLCLLILPLRDPAFGRRLFVPIVTSGTGQSPVQWMPSGYQLSWGDEARRKPMLLFRFSGVLLSRFETRQFTALLFQEPPRFTRFEPYDD